MAEEERPPVVDDELDKLYYADEPEDPPLPRKKVPAGDVYEAARAGDVDRLRLLLDGGVNVNDRDAWDSVALYYACLAGHLDAAQMLLERGAICSEHTFDGDRCHYAALNLKVRRLLKTYEARPPPLAPLQDALRVLFFRSGENSRYVDPTLGVPEAGNGDECGGLGDLVGPDIVFYVQGKPISAHRAILAARSPFFRRKFENEWRERREVRFARNRLSFPALFSLISFFYCDRLDVAVDDMEDLLIICKVCGCPGLQKIIEKELVHQKFAEYKSLRDIDDSQKRFILQSSSLPEDERLPAAMDRLLRLCLTNSGYDNCSSNSQETSLSQQMQERLKLGNDACMSSRVDASEEDYADMCFSVEGRRFRCHRSILAARSDYVRARISRTNSFREGMTTGENDDFIVLEEHDLSADVFQKLLEYIYTDVVEGIDSDQAEEMLDAASRYLLFPLKRVVADALLPQLENASEAELCRWLLVADMYGVWKLKEHCLDSMAADFEIFAATPEFSHMLRKLPPPSGDSSTRTTAPSAPGGVREDQGNLLDDLREKWLEAEGAELDHRDESAKQFDRRLELLIDVAEDGGIEIDDIGRF